MSANTAAAIILASSSSSEDQIREDSDRDDRGGGPRVGEDFYINRDGGVDGREGSSLSSLSGGLTDLGGGVRYGADLEREFEMGEGATGYVDDARGGAIPTSKGTAPTSSAGSTSSTAETRMPTPTTPTRRTGARSAASPPTFCAGVDSFRSGSFAPSRCSWRAFPTAATTTRALPMRRRRTVLPGTASHQI